MHDAADMYVTVAAQTHYYDIIVIKLLLIIVTNHRSLECKQLSVYISVCILQ